MHPFDLLMYSNKVSSGPANSPTEKISFPVFFLNFESHFFITEVRICFTASNLNPSICVVSRYHNPHLKSSFLTDLFLNSISENIKKSKFPFSLLNTFSQCLP